MTERTWELAPPDNTDEDTVIVETLADLAIVKERTGDPVAGTPMTYTLNVSNLGPSTSAAPITITDALPAGTTFVDATAGPGWQECTEDSGVVTCVYDQDLPVGQVAPQVAITVDVPAAAAGELVNTAEVSATTTDPNPDNDTDDDTATIGVSADLRIDKRSTTELVAGANAIYQVRVDNDGPSDAAAVVQITDTLPDGLTFVSAADVEGTWTCASPDDVSFSCDLDGPLAVGDFATVDITVAVDPSVTGDVVNTATVASPTPDPVPGNNTDDDDSAFDTLADLVIDKSHQGDATAGQPLTWTLVVSNDGPSDSQPTITVTDPLPVGVAFVSAAGDGWTCAELDGLITCDRDAVLVAGADVPPIVVVVDVLPDAGPATLVNTASVAGTTNDRDLSNNSDRDDVTVVDLANLVVDKETTGANPVIAGESTAFTVTVTVTNEGPSNADAVTVADLLPGGITATSATGDGWACSLGRVVVCDRDVLGAGEVAEIFIEVDVASSVPDGATLVNEAAVASTATPETTLDDNIDSSTVDVLALADVTIAKSHQGPVRIGSEVAFTIVASNAGPSNANDVQVTDTLPAGWPCSQQPVTDGTVP